ncbi:hypothetical protein BDQ17DRAFT_1184606, partial [Cyathus striatus]
KPLRATKSAMHAHYHAQLTTLILAIWRASPRFHRINRALPHHTLNRFRDTLFTLPRKLSTLLVYLITGHCPLRHHLHRIGKTDNPFCTSCRHKRETVDHFLFHC